MKDYKDTNIQALMEGVQENKKNEKPVEPSIEAEKTEKSENKKDDESAKSLLPKTPTGTRINKRGKNLILLAGAGLGVYIVWAIFGLSPKMPSTAAAPESMNISSSSLNQQQDQGQTLITGLRTQAYGNAGALPSKAPGNPNLPIPPGAVGASPSVPGNLTGLAQQNTSPSQNATGNGGGYDSSNGQQQSPEQQALQSGMQSSLTPDGFQQSAGQQQSSNYNSYTPGSSGNGANAAIAADAASIQALSGNGSSGNQNMQAEKRSFLQDSQSNSNDSLKGGVQTPVSPYMVMAGTIIPATLITGINSDLPGQIQAIVSQNVYDTRTGNYVLIPQGSKLIGTYDSQVAYGQDRVLIVWSRVILPNDQYIDLEGMPGADLTGQAGLNDEVNNHYFRIYGSALLMSIFSAGMQLSQPQSNSVNGAPTNQQIIAGAMGQELGQVSTQMIQKNLNIQPTIQIRSGDNFRVLVTRDIPFSGPYKDNVQQQVLLPNNAN